jgi:hypothetical protein
MSEKIYHTRESILERLQKGPTQFSEWAISKNYKHGSRTQARKIIEELIAEGVARYVHVGRFPYYILNTKEALEQAQVMQIEESSKPSPCGCVLWAGFVDPQRGPTIRPAAGGIPQSVRRLVWERYKGSIGPNDIIKPKCGDNACILLEHMVKKKRNTNHIGAKRNPITRQRITEAQRKRGKLTIDDARQIRLSPEGGPILAKQYGVSVSNISSIRRGKTLREKAASPFAGLLA